jgi:hypothetical protein
VSTIGYGFLTDWVSMNPNGSKSAKQPAAGSSDDQRASLGRNADHAAPRSAIAADHRSLRADWPSPP